MRIKSAFEGSLKKYMEAEYREAERAVTSGIRRATDGLKSSMRAQVTSSGMGRKMANTWRGEVYPKGQNSIRAAGLVYTRASEIMAGFDKGTVIKSKDGWWLAIPTPNAPKHGVGGKRITPSNFPEHRYGKLRFVYRKQGASLLVVDNVRPTKRGIGKAGKRALKSGRGLSTAVMFWLVPQVKMPKLINFEKEAAVWFNRLPGLILSEWRD